jgi:vitamin B12 transporter
LKKQVLLFCSLFLFVPLFLHAADPLEQTTPPALSTEIVVTASALPERADTTPAAITVITRDEIDSRAATDVADVLREVPGVELARSGSEGKATSLFVRGAGSNQTLVLWNGIPINDSYFSGFDWGRVSTTGIERVEVVRGPYSALYGSEAMGGVVNLLTVSRGSRVTADVSAGNRGWLNGAAAAAWGSGPSSGSFSVERRDDDGWSRNDDFRQDTANLAVEWKPGAVSTALLGRFTRYRLGIPFNTSADGTELVPSLHRRQHGNELQIALPASVQLGRAFVSVTASENRRDDAFADPEDPFGFTTSRTRSATTRLAASGRAPTAIGTIVAGGEAERARVDDGSSFGVNLDHATRHGVAFFVEDRFTRELGDGSRLELSAGVRRDDFHQFGSQTSPRLAAALITGATKLRASWGRAFRAPSVGELYFPFSGNRNLDAERSRGFELGADHSWARAAASITLFRSSYDNLIIFDNASYQFQNLGAASSRGVELSASGDLTAHLSAGASYMRLHTEQEDTGAPLLRRPRNSGSAHVTARWGALATTAVVIRSGSRADVLPVFPYSRVEDEAFTTADLSVQYTLAHVSPYFKIENATDHRYEEVRGYRAPGRRFSIGVRALVK